MAKKRFAPIAYLQPYRYRSPNIPLSAIQRFAWQIAERFHPDKIILFGSYAYGQPHAESDVDLLVIMPTRNAIDQAIRIDLAFERPFSLDIHVRTPYQIKQGLKEDDCDWFLREVMEKGKVLYEAPHGSVGAQGRRGHERGKGTGPANAASPKRSRLPLPTGSGEISKGRSAGTRRRRAKDARHGDLCARFQRRQRDSLDPQAFLSRVQRKAALPAKRLLRAC
jgi:predicted nucleotidyltransferase